MTKEPKFMDPLVYHTVGHAGPALLREDEPRLGSKEGRKQVVTVRIVMV